MSHGVDFVPQQRDLPPFQGLIQNEGRSFTNWGLHRSTAPAVFAEPISYGDVQNLVRDEKVSQAPSTRSAQCFRHRLPL